MFRKKHRSSITKTDICFDRGWIFEMVDMCFWQKSQQSTTADDSLVPDFLYC